MPRPAHRRQIRIVRSLVDGNLIGEAPGREFFTQFDGAVGFGRRAG